MISIDLNKVIGEIKPLHGVCCAPYQIGSGPNQSMIDKYFKEASVPYCRLHDCCGSYGGSKFVDITNIFPDFSADENDPASYNFAYTDEYISAIEATGCKTYYRLGETIEWGSQKYATVVPPDFAKWARICEHVIMHYNEGWNNGYNFGIEYWEIWNEPENPGNQNGKCMWQGSKEEFFELYRITAKYLKSKFPNIKIGGYGSCGFYPITQSTAPKSYDEFIVFFKEFLEMAKTNNCPIDFFTWHIYTCSIDELLAHARYVRETLDTYGFNDTEAHLNEWNINSEGTGFEDKHNEIGMAFNSAVFSVLQQTDYVDKAMYYCFSSNAMYNGLINPINSKTEISWYPFVAYKALYDLKNSVEVRTDENDVYAIAAENNGNAAILLTNYGAEDKNVTLNVKNIAPGKKISFKLISANSPLNEVMTMTACADFEISLTMNGNTVILAEIH